MLQSLSRNTAIYKVSRVACNKSKSLVFISIFTLPQHDQTPYSIPPPIFADPCPEFSNSRLRLLRVLVMLLRLLTRLLPKLLSIDLSCALASFPLLLFRALHGHCSGLLSVLGGVKDLLLGVCPAWCSFFYLISNSC